MQKLEAASVESTQRETMNPLLRWKEGMSITPRWIGFSTLSRVKRPIESEGSCVADAIRVAQECIYITPTMGDESPGHRSY